MTRVLVTGGSGLIGKRLLSRLAGKADVVAIGRHDPLVRNVAWVPHDFTMPNLPEFPGDISSVVYLAQSDHFRDFPARARDIFEVNVASVQKVLDWARTAGVRSFILASSGGVYGYGENSFREEDAVGPRGPLGYYLASKRCSELIAGSYSDFFTIIILRFFFVFGLGQKKSMLIPRLVESIRAGTPVTLQGSEGIKLNPIHVDDASLAIVRALDLTESHIINVAGPEVLNLRQIADCIGRAVGRSPLFKIDGEATPRHLTGDISKMCRLLLSPSIRFVDGLHLMLKGDSSQDSPSSF